MANMDKVSKSLDKVEEVRETVKGIELPKQLQYHSERRGRKTQEFNEQSVVCSGCFLLYLFIW